MHAASNNQTSESCWHPELAVAGKLLRTVLTSAGTGTRMATSSTVWDHVTCRPSACEGHMFVGACSLELPQWISVQAEHSEHRWTAGSMGCVQHAAEVNGLLL